MILFTRLLLTLFIASALAKNDSTFSEFYLYGSGDALGQSFIFNSVENTLYSKEGCYTPKLEKKNCDARLLGTKSIMKPELKKCQVGNSGSQIPICVCRGVLKGTTKTYFYSKNFKGESINICVLKDGSGLDFNLMMRRVIVK